MSRFLTCKLNPIEPASLSAQIRLITYKLDARNINAKQIEHNNLRKSIVHVSEITKPKYYGILFLLDLNIFL